MILKDGSAKWVSLGKTPANHPMKAASLSRGCETAWLWIQPLWKEMPSSLRAQCNCGRKNIAISLQGQSLKQPSYYSHEPSYAHLQIHLLLPFGLQGRKIDGGLRLARYLSSIRSRVQAQGRYPTGSQVRAGHAFPSRPRGTGAGVQEPGREVHPNGKPGGFRRPVRGLLQGKEKPLHRNHPAE